MDLKKILSLGRSKPKPEDDQAAPTGTTTGRDRILSSTGSCSDYENYNDDGELIGPAPGAEGMEGERKKMNVSIDVTKALVILGFSNWTELEPGNQD